MNSLFIQVPFSTDDTSQRKINGADVSWLGEKEPDVYGQWFLGRSSDSFNSINESGNSLTEQTVSSVSFLPNFGALTTGRGNSIQTDIIPSAGKKITLIAVVSFNEGSPSSVPVMIIGNDSRTEVFTDRGISVTASYDITNGYFNINTDTVNINQPFIVAMTVDVIENDKVNGAMATLIDGNYVYTDDAYASVNYDVSENGTPMSLGNCGRTFSSSNVDTVFYGAIVIEDVLDSTQMQAKFEKIKKSMARRGITI